MRLHHAFEKAEIATLRIQGYLCAHSFLLLRGWLVGTAVDEEPYSDYCDKDRGEQGEPSPMLSRVAKDADDMASVEMGNEADHGVTDGARSCDQRQELARGVLPGCSGGREEHSGREREGNGAGGDEGTGSPLLEIPEEFGKAVFAKFAIEEFASGVAGSAEGDVSADHRAGSCSSRELVPGMWPGGNEDDEQDIGAAEGRDWGAIENGKEEKSERAQVTEESHRLAWRTASSLEEIKEHRSLDAGKWRRRCSSFQHPLRLRSRQALASQKRLARHDNNDFALGPQTARPSG
jgi:hypothetical protein